MTDLGATKDILRLPNILLSLNYKITADKYWVAYKQKNNRPLEDRLLVYSIVLLGYSDSNQE